MSAIIENMAKGGERVTFTSLSQLMVHLPSRALHCVNRYNGKDMKQIYTLMLFTYRYSTCFRVTLVYLAWSLVHHFS